MSATASATEKLNSVPDEQRLLDPDELELSFLMNSLQHIEKGNAQHFQQQRVDAADKLRKCAQAMRITADASTPPDGQTYGTALGKHFAWNAVHLNSDKVKGSTELQQLLGEWRGNPPYAVFWAQVQEGYLSVIDMERSKVKAQKLASQYKEKLSELPSTDSL
ncbi:hypothetical protein QFC20_007849 [Naganishia adeliensis]|uniref:Uncharacterized protein n=1 Tax=Naganishia adeliensis TaxID=92952 RepID=A0ACC2UUT6_9TREE|nr:hypothetical protein QFC20_007849 [Naganishia adeliensis]